MAYFDGIRASHNGMYRWKIAAACLRAARTLMCCEVGRIWKMEDRFSSCASVSAISRKYLSAFFLPSTTTIDSTWTRKSTNSALGGGNSSGLNAHSGMGSIPRRAGEHTLNAHGERSIYRTSRLQFLNPFKQAA